MAISDLMVLSSDNSSIAAPAGWTRLDQDLNEGAGGRFIYLAYRDTQAGPFIIDITFVVGHAGMPAERTRDGLAGWEAGMRLLATFPNVVVKLCGYGMTDLHWSLDSIRPFVLKPIEWFGPGRAMFGSNFPVDRLMAGYDRLWDAYRTLVADFSPDERAMLLAGTARRIYRI